MFKKLLKLLASTSILFSVNTYAANDTDYYHHLSGRGNQYISLYETTAKKYSVPLSILTRMGAIESGYWNPNIVSGKTKSHKHAIGIAQFIPSTAKHFKINPRNVEQSIDAQGKYLAQLYQEFNSWSLAVAAYNMGNTKVNRYLKQGKPLPKQVRSYVRFVTKELNR